MTTLHEQALVSALEAIRHQLTVGEASEGDKRDIAWCADMAGKALESFDAFRAASPTGREQAIAGVKASLSALIDRGVFPLSSVADHARALLASKDGDACAFFLRERLVSATDAAMLSARTPTQQKAIYAVYEEARYRLSVLDQLDWRPNYRAWSADGAVFDEEKFRAMEADGGFRGISANQVKQIYWQDVLDHVLTSRFYGVRRALIGPARDVGATADAPQGDGVRGSPLRIYIDGRDYTLVTKFVHVGAGRNVAGLRYVVGQFDPASGTKTELLRIDDRMAMDSTDMAEFIRRQAAEVMQARLTQEASVRDFATAVREGLPDDDPYTNGFRDAVESLLLALRGQVAPEVISEAVTTALDAYQNNASELESAGPAPGH